MQNALVSAALLVVIASTVAQNLGLIARRMDFLITGLAMSSLAAGELVLGWSAAWLLLLITALAAWNLHSAFTQEGTWRSPRRAGK